MAKISQAASACAQAAAKHTQKDQASRRELVFEVVTTKTKPSSWS